MQSDWQQLLVGQSPEMRQVAHIIEMVGCRRATVLITGETGTGKEVAATALHLAGPRRQGPFVPLNCSAIPAALLESELFGHARGAFTGAVQSRAGILERAHGGTLFLDEIGDLPLDLQPKLLRVLQERTVQPLGAAQAVRVDVRVVAATNCDLLRRVEEGQFREDLYYRLNVVPIEMPPLRRRRADIPLLAEHLVEKICRLEGIPRKRIAADALERFARHSWPGNVREFENAIEMAIALSGDRAWLAAADFPSPARATPAAVPAQAMPGIALPEDGLDYQQTLASIERSILEQALQKT